MTIGGGGLKSVGLEHCDLDDPIGLTVVSVRAMRLFLSEKRQVTAQSRYVAAVL